jgi:uncharacterized protein (TIGR04222 family)
MHDRQPFDLEQHDLYQCLQAFDLDDPTHVLGFSQHLMRSQGWTDAYTQRAIEEYKKFAFLAVVTNHQVVPSDAVDQVWHTHILLTQSYGEEFCLKVLGQMLHHQPTQGGKAERAKFHRLYVETMASYRQFFGVPPIDIWPPTHVRFGADLKMQRVNLSHYWLIPKRLPRFQLPQSLKRGAIAVGMAILGILIAQGMAVAQDQAKLSNFWGDDRTLLIVFAALFVVGLGLRYIIRSPSKQPQKPQLDAYQVAYLAGGTARAVDLAIVQLVHEGYLRPNVADRTLTIVQLLTSPAPALVRQVMRGQTTRALKDLRKSHRYKTDFLSDSLAQEKLMMRGMAAFLGCSFGLVPLLGFLGCILYTLVYLLQLQQWMAWIVAQSLNLAIALGLLGVIPLCCLTPRLRTRWGDRVLKEMRKNHDVYDVTSSFALYGDSVLSGGALDDLKQMMDAQAAEDAASACGC